MIAVQAVPDGPVYVLKVGKDGRDGGQGQSSVVNEKPEMPSFHHESHLPRAPHIRRARRARLAMELKGARECVYASAAALGSGFKQNTYARQAPTHNAKSHLRQEGGVQLQHLLGADRKVVVRHGLPIGGVGDDGGGLGVGARHHDALVVATARNFRTGRHGVRDGEAADRAAAGVDDLLCGGGQMAMVGGMVASGRLSFSGRGRTPNCLRIV